MLPTRQHRHLYYCTTTTELGTLRRRARARV